MSVWRFACTRFARVFVTVQMLGTCAAVASVCRQPHASSNFTAVNGLIPETAKQKFVVIGNTDPVLLQPIRENLPEGVGLIQITPSGLGGAQAWVRDYFPEFISIGGKIIAVQFRYESSIGERFDGQLEKLAKSSIEDLGIEVRESNLFLEGGNLLADEAGNLFATEKILGKNSKVSRKEIEKELKGVLGVRRVHWFKSLPNEPTGHIDLMAKFISKNTVLVGSSNNPAQRKVLNETALKFKRLGYDVRRVKNADRFSRVTMSYVNSLIVGDVAFVPSYALEGYPGDVGAKLNTETEKRDVEAQEIYRKLGYKVVPIAAYLWAVNGGSVHCLTKQIPNPTSGSARVTRNPIRR